MNLEFLHQTERQLAAWYVHKGAPPSERLETAAFSDPAAVAILRAVECVEANGEPVSTFSVQNELSQTGNIPCSIGELAGLLVDTVATEQPQCAVESMRREIQAAFARRDLERAFSDSITSLRAGAEPGEILAKIQSHHLPEGGFGSFGSFDLGPFEPEKPFPTDALPHIGARMTREISRVAMVPESLAAAAVLGVISAAVGGGLRVRNYKGATGANLFILAVAASGCGKDSALNLAAKPLFEIEAERLERWEAETKPELLADLRRIASRQKDAGDDRESLRQLEIEKGAIERALVAVPDLIVGDATKEALGVALAAQPTEAISGISSEARGILGTMAGRYSNGSDEDFFCGAFSGTPLKVTRIGRPPVRLKRPTLSLLWMVQPDAFRKLAGNSAMIESGFLPRFLFFDSKAQPLDVPEDCPEIDPELAAQWDALIRALVEVFHDSETQGVATPSRDASERLRAFDNETRSRRKEGGDLVDVNSFAARWPEIAWRMALNFHAALYRAGAPDKPLELRTAESAIAVVEWFAGETLTLLEAIREDRRRERKARLRDLLAGADGGRMTLRDLAKSHGFEASEIEAIAKRETWLAVQPIQNAKGGPRSLHAVFRGERP